MSIDYRFILSILIKSLWNNPFCNSWNTTVIHSCNCFKLVTSKYFIYLLPELKSQIYKNVRKIISIFYSLMDEFFSEIGLNKGRI